MTPPDQPRDVASTCPECGVGFACGVDRPPTGPCWCTAVELGPRQLDDLAQNHVGCLCPTCLRSASTST